MFFELMLFVMFVCADCMFYPNIQDDSVPCNLTLKDSIFYFKRSLYSITHEDETVYFSPCLRLEGIKCSKTAMVCVKSKFKTTNFDEFNTINSTFFTVHDKNCKTSVSLSQELEPKVTKLKDECGYELRIPNPNLKSSCTKEINNQMLEFFQQPDDIEIVQNNTKIIINLCRPSKKCQRDDSSICSINSNQTTSLGYTEKRTINYYTDKGVEFKFKTTNDGPLSFVSLKCNWTTMLGDVQYKAVSTKTHKISIETYLGCVKLSPRCVITFEQYIYNLTSLNNPEGWKVANNFGKDIVINICGSLLSTGFCSDQHSQICHYPDEGLEENYGTTMTILTVDDDILKTSFKDGFCCPNRLNESLSTNLNFICSFEEKGPILKSIKECSYDIEWQTPHACPKLIDLQSTHATFKPCSVTKDHITYDLSGLTSNSSNHVVRTPKNIDYIINVCRSVIVDNNTLCQPTMGICSKNNGEPNIKKRFSNLGNVHAPIIENNQLVLRYKYGNWKQSCKKDASAVIFFNCSTDEVGPTFIKEQNCEYVFTWQTKYACPQDECMLTDALGNTVSLNNAQKKMIKFVVNQTEYTLDICTPSITTQTKGIIYTFTTNRTIYNERSDLFIQYELNRVCQPDSFNVIRIHPKCDVITSNEHYDFENIADCVLNVNFKHHLICKLPKTTEVVNIVRTHVTTKTNEEDCTYQYHGTKININTLQPVTVISSTNRKYTIGINRTSNCQGFVCGGKEKLGTLDDCPKAKSKNDELVLVFESSEVVFVCKKSGDLPKILREGPNNASFQYPLEEVCLETHNYNLFYIIGSVISVLVIIVCLFIYKKDLVRQKFRSGKKNSTYVYCKNGED